MTAKSLTEQMIEDYRPYVKPDALEAIEWLTRERERTIGPVVSRTPVYSEDGKRVVQILYSWGGGLTSVLDARQAGVDSLPF